jgi:hypothetical protein
MNDGNVRYYLEGEMAQLKNQIQMKEANLEGYSRRIDDCIKDLKNLRTHYTSLLNTAIAYGYEVEEDE